MCTDGGDCLGFSCLATICEPEHCGDGMRSGDELGVDCGGSCGTACVVYDCASQTQIPVAECEKLKDYYNAADGPNWATIADWFSDAIPCSWAGITCTAIPGNIEELHVLESAQHGVIARGMDTLSELTYLEINPINCCVQRTEMFGPIPVEFSNFSKLRRLEISQNELTGNIPPELGQLTNLVLLFLHTNRLTGPIPVELGQLTNLTSFALNTNRLTGTIPAELGQLVKVTNLQLHTNQLTGTIPAQLGQLAKLFSLQLSFNQLTGGIPSELGQLTQLSSLLLHANQLTGTLPPELGQLTSLSSLWLHSNQFTGAMPGEITDLSMLINLNICPQTGSLTSDVPTGNWLRSITMTDWPAGNSC